MGSAGLAYYLDRHQVSNFMGIVTSDFVNPDSALCNVEVLRHYPEKRFDYWLIKAPDSEEGWRSWFVGDQVLAQVPLYLGRNSRVLHRTDWSNLIGTADPVTPGVLDRVMNLEEVDRMDTGFLEDEKRTGYWILPRTIGWKLLPRIIQGKLVGGVMAEACRVVIGEERFHIRTRPGKPLVVVMRTTLKAYAKVQRHDQEFSFGSPLTLVVYAGEQKAGEHVIDLKEEEDLIEEIVFEIPGELITGPDTEITVGGDHISLGYWFYQ